MSLLGGMNWFLWIYVIYLLIACSEGESNLQRDNPLYESQEIRMEMFADDSDEDAGGACVCVCVCAYVDMYISYALLM